MMKLLLTPALVLLGLSMSVGALSVEKLVMALKPDKNPELMLREKQALESFLGQRLGKPVEVIIPLSAATILEGLANGTIDLGYLSATDMVNAHRHRLADILLAGLFPDGRTAYDSYWVVLADAPYRSIEDLRGQPVAFASRTSTSGFVIPVLDLHRRGLIDDSADLEAFFGRGHIYFGVGYVSAIERLLAGEARAAAVSYYVLDGDKHLSAEQRSRLRKLQAQGPVPSHVIAHRATLPPDDVAELRAILQELNDDEHAALRDKLFSTKLVPVDTASHLAPMVQATDLARSALQH